MAALALAALALVTVILSFAFAALVVFAHPKDARTEAPDETLSRVVADIERLAALRERGALTVKEFNAQKAKLLHD